MELKENTKRNSKTYKKVIGYSQPWKMVTSEIIKFQTQSAEQQRQLSKLATEFLPEHLEICNWEKNMNYSLKKNGRWKILPKLKAVWREFADELADMETDVQVFDLGPRLGGSIVYESKTGSPGSGSSWHSSKAFVRMISTFFLFAGLFR